MKTLKWGGGGGSPLLCAPLGTASHEHVLRVVDLVLFWNTKKPYQTYLHQTDC